MATTPRPDREYACSKPCSECPFRRDYPIEELGKERIDPLRLIGQAHSPFWLPCHMDPDYQGAGKIDVRLSQCAGAAIYRANVGLSDAMPEYMHKLPADPEGTFTAPDQLLAHHLRIPIEEAQKVLKACPPIDLTIIEFKKAGPAKMMVSEKGARAGEGKEIRDVTIQQVAYMQMLDEAEKAKAAGETVLSPETIERLGKPNLEDVKQFAREHGFNVRE